VVTELHPLIEAAGRTGALPDWAVCRPDRRAHAARVADLMSGWATTLGLEESEIIRWTAAGHLHDALKDAPVPDLVPLVDSGWPDPLVHAAACATRLREDGVRDEELLLAIAYHSTGHPDFGSLGEFLYMADFLDPGRRFLASEREKLRGRLPTDRDPVLLEVLRHRITMLLDHGTLVLPVSLLLWNRVVAS
jgi:2-amino-4-hydroxy-6-hydroxymethyldihydropteridine diphosphokinase